MDKYLRSVKSGWEVAFPKKELDRRIAALREVMAKKKIDLYLTSGAENIFYLCGQQTPGYYMFQCLGVPAKGSPFLIMRATEAFNARANTYLANIVGYVDDANPAAVVAEYLVKRGWKRKRVAVDLNAWFLTVKLYERLVEDFGKVRDGSGMVEGLRRIKSPLEIKAILNAAKANDAGILAGIEEVKAGATENDVAAAVMYASIKAGGEYVGMEPFVSTSPRNGLVHSTWRRRRIKKGDTVILETSACYDRYHAAVFRTAAVGQIPAKAQDMFKVVQELLDAGLEQMKPGNSCADPHHAVQAVVDKSGYSYAYRKRTGYSLGISFAPDWGEGNILSLFRGVDVELQPGMVFHMPITLREYGKWTVAESESVLITERGSKILSKVPRGLIQV